LTGDDLAHGNADLLEGCPEGLGGLLALGIQLPLLGDIVEVERIGVGLVRMGGAVPHNDDVTACAQRLGKLRVAGARLRRCRGA
jgi:hypothetical protein